MPFAMGIASGDPSTDGFVIGTRLLGAAPADAPIDPVPVAIAWEVADDPSFSRIVARGRTLALPAFAHAVQVEVAGLRPDRWYWYRFHAGLGDSSATSPIGRSRTTPDAAGAIGRWRLAFASCQQYEQGYYGAYRHLLADGVDLVVFLGDYIYESSWGQHHVRHHGTPEPVTLDEYRARHALYRSDPHLQAMHAAVPWVACWDDHEVQNDYAGDQAQDLAPDFPWRRAAGYRAWAETMPQRPMARRMAQAVACVMAGASADAGQGRAGQSEAGCSVALADWQRWPIHRQFDIGPLLSLILLDDRQYRSPQACPSPGRGGGRIVRDCVSLADPSRTLLGFEQERWLDQRLRASRATWTLIGQQTLFSRADREPGPGEAFSSDTWDGYPAARQRLLDSIAGSRVSNPLIIGGDVHANWVSAVRADFDRPGAPVIASEFCGTSITSQGGPQARHDQARDENPWFLLAESRHRGYGLMTLDRQRCVTELRVVDDVRRPDPAVSTLAAFEVRAGQPGPRRIG